MKYKNGFTLVELLIVIALIAILSVAVLATINPIEQANKARDARVMNDAAEVMNGYERFYANSQEYPWMKYPTVNDGQVYLTVDSAAILRSDQVGFGICYGTLTTSYLGTGACNTTGNLGALISADELKASFVGKDEFQTVATKPENGLWLYKATGSGGSVYVCFIPKAKSNRSMASKLYCLNTVPATPIALKASVAGDLCVALTSIAATWDTPALDGVAGMFMCVPE